YIGYRDDIPDLLNASDLFVLPSTLPDPFPTVILEAMASGKPVAATAHGGALEMIDTGRTGIHIPFDDASVAAQKILDMARSKEELAQMGQRGRAKIKEQYSLEAFRENILRAVREV
ncbi:MAG: glycosyltransferase, partial [Sphingobacteriales bacterium]